MRKISLGRRVLNFNWEFKVFSTNAREQYYKTIYFDRRGKKRWNESRNELMKIMVSLTYNLKNNSTFII